MRRPRRRFLGLMALTAAHAAGLRAARAQAYPARPVRIIVGFAAGGAADIVARLMAQWLSQRLGQSFIVENRPGAGSNTAAEAVVRAPPDGYTLLHVTVSNAINQTLYDKLGFDIRRDIAPVASIYGSPGVLVVNPAVPANTVAELIAYAKARPGEINMASAGNGSPQHLYGELFKAMTGVALVHVPYRAYPGALADLIGGQVQVMFDALASSLPHIRAGRLRALALTTTGALAGIAGHPDRRRIRARLCGERLAGPRRAARARRPRSSRRSTGRSRPASPIPR